MKNTKIISYILSALMICAMLCVCVLAADEEFSLGTDYLTEKYASAEEKLATMGVVDEKTGERKPNFENDEYEIWAHEDTGEVGFVVKSTGQIILTNPYDVASSKATDAIKQKLLSQIILQYKDSAGTVVEFSSYANAALNGKVVNGKNINQIKVLNTRNGVRVEYAIGKEQARYIVPMQIEASSFMENIYNAWTGDRTSKDFRQLMSLYVLKDPNDKSLPQTMINSMKEQFPATEKYAIYVLDQDISARELSLLEGYLKANTDYDSDQLAEDYELIDYVDTSAAPAIFRFAIEYSIDEYGLSVSLPANSITYDSTNYTLVNVKLLPYLGAGNNDNTGFTLLADGSGTITRFEDIKGKQFTLTSKLYGRDYSYHSISGYTMETMRMPVYGVLENVEDKSAESADGETQYISRGFVAYYDEGDSLVELSSDHGGTIHNYSSAYATFYPRASDTYELTGISSDGNAEWTVTSDRKYVGDYKMRVLPIYGKDKDYTDMASSVREYLEKKGVLKRLDKEEEKSEDVSLYIENFGTIKTDEKVLGFPVKKQTALTTFDQTKEMIDDLNKEGITNINFKLTGWYNGGMEHTAPSKLSIPSSVGGKSGLKDLASYAESKNVGIYPDLDYTYVNEFKSFDGISKKNDTVKTIDGRNAVHRVYNALYQGFDSDEKAVISPASLSKLYKKVEKTFSSLGTTGISVASLGYDLNSDFNEDYIINRQDSEELVKEFLAELKEKNGSVMVDGGNAYALEYVDHILGVPLDSSMNINTSQSVPFMGMVLHGYVEFAGTPINLDGDYEYSFLKAIENGASLYFMVSKDNTSELKAFSDFSKYYAISYDNWMSGDINIVDTYKTFNEAMKDVKYSLICEHEYIGTRLVRVKYDNGTEFILNYNTHEVTTDDGTTVEAMSFVKR